MGLEAFRKRATLLLELEKGDIDEKQRVLDWVGPPANLRESYPQTHGTYKASFNLIDRFNKMLSSITRRYVCTNWRAKYLSTYVAMSLCSAWVLWMRFNQVDGSPPDTHNDAEELNLRGFLNEVVKGWANELPPTPTGRNRNRATDEAAKS